MDDLVNSVFFKSQSELSILRYRNFLLLDWNVKFIFNFFKFYIEIP